MVTSWSHPVEVWFRPSVPFIVRVTYAFLFVSELAKKEQELQEDEDPKVNSEIQSHDSSSHTTDQLQSSEDCPPEPHTDHENYNGEFSFLCVLFFFIFFFFTYVKKLYIPYNLLLW